MTTAIVTLISQISQILDEVAPQLKEEANKKIVEISQKIPTEASIKQMLMDEITSRGAELICNIEVRNRITSIYNKFKDLMTKLKDVVDKINQKLEKLHELIDKISQIINDIEVIFNFLEGLVPVFDTISRVSKIAIKLLKGLAADGATTVKLKDLIDKSSSKKEEIKNSIKVFTKRIEKINRLTQIPEKILRLAKGVMNVIKLKIDSILGLVESYYFKYLTLCDVEGDSVEDEDYSTFLNEANNKLEDSEITLIADDLLPNTIERIRNAKFEVIQYRIA